MSKPRRVTPIQALEFISQTGGKTIDPALKRKVRQHARSYTSRAKGVEKPAPLLQVSLDVPESFGSLQSSRISTPASSFAYLSHPETFGGDQFEEPSLGGNFLPSPYEQNDYGQEDIPGICK